MESLIRHLAVDEHGQDTSEYALLMVFVVLAGAAIFLASGASFAGIWALSNSQVVAAGSAAS